MKRILVDTSVWISFFKGDEAARPLSLLLDSNFACVNDLVLSELIPSILHKKEKELAILMQSIEVIPMAIDWKSIIRMQTINLEKGINKVGIADLLIAQNAIQYDLSLYTLDKHFEIMSKYHRIASYCNIVFNSNKLRIHQID